MSLAALLLLCVSRYVGIVLFGYEGLIDGGAHPEWLIAALALIMVPTWLAELDHEWVELPDDSVDDAVEQHIRACYLDGRIDYVTFELAMTDVITNGQRTVPSYVPQPDRIPFTDRPAAPTYREQ